MTTNVFVNLPVKELDLTVEFFTKLGFMFNPQFTDENAACMIISDDSFVMRLVEDFFKTFTHKEISAATKTTEVIVSLSVDSRQAVDKMVATAVAAGATTPNAARDYGFMYQHGFQDLDRHLWEVFFMDPAAVNPGQA
jgi:hypothetical protein